MGTSNVANVLCVVDCQVDFAEGGSLAVAGGIACSERIVDFLDRRAPEYDLIIFTRDWHNPWPDLNGGHFAENPDFADSWPPHCQAGTEGADYLPVIEDWLAHARGLNIVEVKKGQGCPAYSGFEGTTDSGIFLAEAIKASVGNHYDLDVCGIAFDYCVKETALTAIIAQRVRVFTDLSVGISRHSEIVAAAEMAGTGIQLVESK